MNLTDDHFLFEKFRYWLRKHRRTFARRVGWCAGGLATVIPIAIGANTLWEKFAPLTKVDLTGRWCVTDVVTKSQFKKYVGMKLVFDFILVHENGHIRGSGKKALVDGKPPPPLETSWIEIKEGFLQGNTVTLNFIERNDARPDRQYLGGTFIWTVRDDKTLVGKFDTAAAGSSGESIVRKCETLHE